MRRSSAVPDPVTLERAFAAVHDHWAPAVLAELNGQQVKAVKFRGEFAWHHHATEDEMFLIMGAYFVP